MPINKSRIRSRNGRQPGQRIPKDEQRSADFFLEFEERIHAGERPDTEEYVTRYGGPVADKLRMALNLLAFLSAHRQEISERWTNIET